MNRDYDDPGRLGNREYAIPNRNNATRTTTSVDLTAEDNDVMSLMDGDYGSGDAKLMRGVTGVSSIMQNTRTKHDMNNMTSGDIFLER
jgi:hypothetical protein